MKQKDLKLLWGRSGNRCAFCRALLTQDASAVTAPFTLGEQAHIIGEKAGSARSVSPMTAEERDGYHNRILLCPTHHTEIDENENDWPIEKLHYMKSTHELWVTERLSETVDHVRLANEAILANIADRAVELCWLDRWIEWTSWALSPDPQWPSELPGSIYRFAQVVAAAIWPRGFDEYRCASSNFALSLHNAASLFMVHSEEVQGTYRPHKFYKVRDPNPNYHADLAAYNKWREDCYRALYEATKAANWFGDVVRESVNPMFFALEGKFMVEDGPFEDFMFHTRVLEYTSSEKEALRNKHMSA